MRAERQDRGAFRDGIGGASMLADDVGAVEDAERVRVGIVGGLRGGRRDRDVTSVTDDEAPAGVKAKGYGACGGLG